MEKLVFDHHIAKESEGLYYTLDFAVPAHVERLSVTYSYARFSGTLGKRAADLVNVVDLGLMDASGRFLGWSGSSRSSVTVGEFESTKGYRIRPVEPGTWHIIVGAYKIPAGGLDVHYEIEFAEKRPRWLYGDLHMHSDASDGQHDIPALAKKARAIGLDFIAVSNHNNYSENINLPSFSGLTLIPAVEWTHYKGHMNFFGVEQPFENSFVANSEAEMLVLIGEAKRRGALVSVNHPKCTLCPCLWEDERYFDMIEVWNGPMRKVNMDGIAWWHALLRSGRRIPLVGGSDFHRDRRPVRMGHPVTALYSASPSPDDLLAAMGAGHGYVTSGIKGPRLSLRCGEHIMGDAVSQQAGQAVSFGAENLGAGMRLELVGPDGPVAAGLRSGNAVSGEIPAPSSGFLYLIVRRKILFWERVCAISNPLYFG